MKAKANGLAVFAALSAMLCCDPALADVINPQQPTIIADSQARYDAITDRGRGRCNWTLALRGVQYSAQIVDSLVSGAAVSHGAIGRTPIGGTSPALG